MNSHRVDYSVVEGPLTAEALYGILKNVQIREALRRFAPQHALVFVNRRGEVVAVARSKEMVSPTQHRELATQYPGNVSFFITPEMVVSPASLQDRIADCARAFDIPRPPGGRGIV